MMGQWALVMMEMGRKATHKWEHVIKERGGHAAKSHNYIFKGHVTYLQREKK